MPAKDKSTGASRRQRKPWAVAIRDAAWRTGWSGGQPEEAPKAEAGPRGAVLINEGRTKALEALDGRIPFNVSDWQWEWL